jgi:hypothetical protein
MSDHHEPIIQVLDGEREQRALDVRVVIGDQVANGNVSRECESIDFGHLEVAWNVHVGTLGRTDTSRQSELRRGNALRRQSMGKTMRV